MSNNQERLMKALKRRLSEEDDIVSKRIRIEKTLGRMSPKKNDSKNLATNRLTRLRRDNRKNLEYTLHEKNILKNEDNRFVTPKCNYKNQNSKSTKLHIDLNAESSNTANNLRDSSRPLNPPMRGSINDRFKRDYQRSSCKNDSDTNRQIDESNVPLERYKRARQRGLRKSDDDIIVEIDDSPAPVLNQKSKSVTPPKKSSINDRFKRARQQSPSYESGNSIKRQSDERNIPVDKFKRTQQRSVGKNDDTIVKVDDSPSSVLNKNNDGNRVQKSKSLLRRKVDDPFIYKSKNSTTVVNEKSPMQRLKGCSSSEKSPVSNIVVTVSPSESVRTSGSFSLSRSFTVVSEAAGSEDGCTKNLLNQRLRRIRKGSGSSSTSSTSKTLTPGSTHELERPTRAEPVVAQKVSGGLRIPLNRNIFKSPRAASSDCSRGENIDGNKDTSRDTEVSKKSFGVQVSCSIFKKDTSPNKNIFATKVQSDANNDNKTISPQKSIFGAKVPSNMIRKDLSPTTVQKDNVTVNAKPSSDDISLHKSIFGGKASSSILEKDPFSRQSNIFATISEDAVKDHDKYSASLHNSIFGAPVSSTVLQRDSSPRKTNIFATKLLDTVDDDVKRSSSNVSPSTSTFETVISQNSTVVSKSPVKRLQSSNSGRLAGRLDKIRNQIPSTSKNATNIFEKKGSREQSGNLDRDEVSLSRGLAESHPPTRKNETSTVTAQSQNRISQLQYPSLSKSAMVENWMESVHSRPSVSDQTINDSLVVNWDDTLLNKTEILTEQQEDDSMEWDTIPEPPNIDKPPESAPAKKLLKEKYMCIVTDTNVLMHDLDKVKDILNFKPSGKQELKIYIPWMVLQELDHLKDHSPQPARSIALTAQKFINKHLEQPNSKIIGQSVKDVCQQMDLGKCPDDKILACCLQAQEKYESVILLSSDINLRNKALTNDIKACAPREILGKLKSSKFLKIKVRLQTLLSQIIFHSCKEAFGDIISRIDMLQGCPWSFEGCLQRFKKYWSSVFGHLLLKQCSKTIDELITFHDRVTIEDSEREFIKFKDKVKEFLFYLQDVEQFSGSVKKMRDEIDNIAENDCIV